MVLLLTPRMPVEAPPAYVAFVQRHLPRLRADATRLVGEHGRPEDVYPDALTDVAGRWGLLGRLVTVAGWLGRRPLLADGFLRRALAGRAKLWRDQQITPVEVRVWTVDPDPTPSVTAAAPGAGPAGRDHRSPAPFPAGLPAPATPPGPVAASGAAGRPALAGLAGLPFSWEPGAPPARPGQGAAPAMTSMALRLAPVLPGNERPELAALAEAAIAWWHAYRAACRRRYAIAASVLTLLLGLLSQVPDDADRYLRSAPPPPAPVSWAPAPGSWSWSTPPGAAPPGSAPSWPAPPG